MNEEIKSLILDLCKGKEWDWENHVLNVVKHSKDLAKKLGADVEVVEIAAWLHDIIKIRDGLQPDHHIEGAKEAEKILLKYDYPKEIINNVKDCIITHSSDKNFPPHSLEAKIVASADALSHFDNFLALCSIVFRLRKYSIQMARPWLIDKYKKSWEKLMPEAKEIAKEKYDAINLLLEK